MAKEQVSENSDLSAILPYLMKTFFPEKTSGSESSISSTGAEIGPLLRILQQMNPDLVAEQAKEGVNYQTDRLLQSNFAPYLAAVNASGGYNTGNQFLAQLIADTAGQGAKLATDTRLEAGKTSEAAAREVATNTRTTSTNNQQAQTRKNSVDLKSLGTSLLLSAALKKAGGTMWDKLTSSSAGEQGVEQLSGPGSDASLGGIAEGHGGTGASSTIDSSVMTNQAFGAPPIETAEQLAGPISDVFAPEVIPAEAFATTSPEGSSAAVNAAGVGGNFDMTLSPGAQAIGVTDASDLQRIQDEEDMLRLGTKSASTDSAVIDSGSSGDVITGGDYNSALVGSSGSDAVAVDTTASTGSTAGSAATGEGTDLTATEAAGSGAAGSVVSGVGLVDAVTEGDLHRGAEELTQEATDSKLSFIENLRKNTDPGEELLPTSTFEGYNEDIINSIPTAEDAGSVVCTEALKQGLMSMALYQDAHQKMPGQITINGYHFVATPIVLKMRKDPKFAKQAASWAVKYCEHSINKKKSIIGFLLYWIARPICFVVGSIVGPQDIDEVLYHG
jgi:hypothetical protein